MGKNYVDSIFSQEENKIMLGALEEKGINFSNRGVQEILKELSTSDAEIVIDDRSISIMSKKYGNIVKNI